MAGIAITSVDQRWLGVTDGIPQILGYRRKDLKRLSWGQLTHPDDLDADVLQFHRLLKGEISQYTIDKRYITRSDRVVSARMDGRSVYSSNGELSHIVSKLTKL